jgi:RimJ/RimL family protein N-acetyltransferase
VGEYLSWQNMLLKSRDIYLRFLRKSDAARCFAAIEESRAELDHYLIWPPRKRSAYDGETLVERLSLQRRRKQAFGFGIFDRSAKEFLGTISLHGVASANRSGEVGCWVRSSQTGKGIATTAAALIVLFGFKELKLHRIVLRAAVDNPASWQIAEKIGFVCEGTQRHEQLMQRGWVDLKCYSMLEDEYRKLKPKIAKLAKGKKD